MLLHQPIKIAQLMYKSVHAISAVQNNKCALFNLW